MKLTRDWVRSLKHIDPFLPFDNPTFNNPDFQSAPYRVLIIRLSPLRDVDRSIPHLFLFHEVRKALPHAFIDMAFFPSLDTRESFEQENIHPMIGVQSLRSAEEFDLVLVSNAYTLELINLPYLLIHSGFPLFSSQRGPEWPIIILGGSNSMAAQSIIREDSDSLVDGVFFGEGEGFVGNLAYLLQSHREISKREQLELAAQQIEGLWTAGSFRHTKQAVLHRPEAQFLALRHPILNSSEVHTASLQINYGCPAFCSFCFEGYDRKPYRELPLSDVLPAAYQIKQAQGVEALKVYSFNFNSHQDILTIILELQQLFDRVGLTSQRLDILHETGYLLEAEIEADKRDFTLGIEGISQRQRAWLHKSLSEADVVTLLSQILSLKIRRIKLFYILTGYETEADIAEFRQFLKWLKKIRRSRNRHVRVIFSFGLLIRMPFTPLRYDRLFLDERAWRPLIGKVKSACETNGFEFRLAFNWPAYCTTQVLALGGYWLVEPTVALARKGYCFDTTLDPEYWDELKVWMEREGYWNKTLLGEKGRDYPFTLDFVEPSVSTEFLYQQYREANARTGSQPSHGKRSSGEEAIPTTDSGYCLGSAEQLGRCLGCGACWNNEQRRTITHHQIHQPEREPYMAKIAEVMTRKHRLEPAYYLVRLPPWLAGVLPEFLNAFVFRDILFRCPELVDNLLSVRESLFTVRPNEGQFPFISGETIFALKAWDGEALSYSLDAESTPIHNGTDATLHSEKDLSPESQATHIVGPAKKFTPGLFTQVHLNMRLPAKPFHDPQAHLEQYLRSAYVPYSLRRDDTYEHQGRGTRYYLDLPDKALKKKIVFNGFFKVHAPPRVSSPGESIEHKGEGDGDFFASLDVGPKFDLAAFLLTFGEENLSHYAQVQVSEIKW